MIRAPQTTLSAVAGAITLSCNNSLTAAEFLLKSNSSVGFQVIYEFLPPGGGTTWYPIAVIDMATLTIIPGGTITLVDGTSYTHRIPNINSSFTIRCRVVALTSGTFTADANGFASNEVAPIFIPIGIVTASTAQAISSTSAQALAVGANGTTNPVFSVNANTASVATGLTVIGAAAAGGVALNTISSGTNENLVINAKGSGTIDLNPTGTGNVLTARGFLSRNATAGIGYATGAGGAVTQATSRTTGVTLNTITGAITLVSAAGSATPFSFTVTNSAVAATDSVIINQVSGTDVYTTQQVTAVGAGSFRVTLANASGTTTEQPVFKFTVIKGVSS